MNKEMVDSTERQNGELAVMTLKRQIIDITQTF
jgi:hypothetical protein